MPLLDTLDENSHKHAFAVSEDLKYSLRKAIELLGNEAVWFLREKAHEKIYGRDMAGQLTRECLRYMYRMLFLFYIEARPELEYLPDKKSKEYHKGYSLESLRELEMVQLTTNESKNGFYFHESVSLLFDLLYNGFQPEQADMFGTPDHHTFRIAPLRSHLFDPEQTPLLNRVKLRNFVMQEIIELMSLSRPKKGKKNRRGRISYAQLGINQLGAVYEALLSYQGFFAETELYEVKKAGEKHNVLETAYFVKPEDIEQYTEDERVYNDDGTLVKYEKGTFIYRLAGRDREKSASYYTPEVLTQCLVKYALKELLKDKTADEILELTVCEPAMGSAAFLNEAVNQLARAYLDRKQKEIDQIISHEDYPKELQKVKMYIADNNVYGVDLNPVAVELAEVSLWLNTIYEGGFVPWFGMQLVCGNSLIGARRQVFHTSHLKKKKKTDPLWLDEVPERVLPGEKRGLDTVYHFLLPDKGMADYKDKVIKQMAADEIKAINEWRKEFTKPFSKTEIEQLKKLSAAIDKLWKKHAEMQQYIDERTTDPLNVFGQKAPDKKPQLTTTEFKDRIYQQEILSENVRNSSPYRRLRLVMNYWCTLWFWPIQKTDLLPSRAEFLFDLSLILEGNLYDSNVDKKGQQSLFPDTRPKQMSLNILNELGHVDVDRLCEENKRLGLVKELAERYRYLHWELEFADLFKSRGGFDLVLGNPPWIKVIWKKENILCEFEPFYEIKNYKAPQIEKEVKTIINTKKRKRDVFDDYACQTGMKNYLNSLNSFPILKKLQSNLYKCFLTQSWYIGNKSGVAGFVHESELFSESKGMLKRNMYIRLYSYWHFMNELKLFKDVLHTKKFACSITSTSPRKEVEFYSIVNLFHPRTIHHSHNHNGLGSSPGIKTKNNQWEMQGHKNRIVRLTENYLDIFRNIFESSDIPLLDVRIPNIHSTEILKVIRKLLICETKINDIERTSEEMFHETNAINEGIIIEKVGKVTKANDVVLSGPHIYNCNPFYQEIPEDYKNKQDFVLNDLTQIELNFYPNTIYKISNEKAANRLTNSSFRNVRRKMVYPMAERTLITAIIPPNVKHINGIISEVFENDEHLIVFTGLSNSLIYDFFIKIIGKTNLYNETINILPFKIDVPYQLKSRVLRLNCLNIDYSELWENNFDERFKEDGFTKVDSRFSAWDQLKQEWTFDTPLRNSLERRQALVELDVLAAMSFGISFEELCSIYRIQFPILNKNENGTWYDLSGKVVYSVNTAYSSNNRKDILESWDGNNNKSIEGYCPPFETFDREKDYQLAWCEFERRFEEQEGQA